jgi:tetratricopeptide (TPR) repeat protein
MEKVYSMSKSMFEKGLQPATGFPIFEYIISYSLNYGDDFTNIVTLSQQVLKRYEIVSSAHTWRHQMFHLIYSRALLNIGELQAAVSLYKRIAIGAIPVNNKYYVRLRYYLIRVEFLTFEKKRTEALTTIEEIKTIAKMIKHQFFYDRALLFEKKVRTGNIFNDKNSMSGLSRREK